MRHLLRLTAALSFAALAGCATLDGELEKPSVHLADISLRDASLFEQRYRLALRVQNPNNVDLPIQAVSYELTLNDKPFGRGSSNTAVTIPRNGSALVEVDGISTLSDLLRQLPEFRSGNLSGVRYRMQGKLTIGRFSPLTMPFDYQGEIGLPDWDSFTGPPKTREF